MSQTDWLVLGLTLLLIVSYGLWKSRGTKNIEGYLLADRQLPWYHVGLSVMATQASAITFLSAPGQGYSDGLTFVQFYFGLPLAMVVLCTTFIPIFHRLNVYTAYEYLEKRFDVKTRSLTAFLFLLQRGLSTGVTICAPAIVLSVILKIEIVYTTLFIGGIVIFYTAYGGTKAVSYTQMFQMSIIFAGLFLAAYMVVHLLPENVSFTDALHIAGKMDRMNAITSGLKENAGGQYTFDWNDKYNIISGIIGGFFLQLSYFGTDQSQVGRYLTGKSITQSRLGLIMNGLVKIPMQFLILLIGTMVFTFYQFHQPPLFFNEVEAQKLEKSEYRDVYKALEQQHATLFAEKTKHVNALVEALHHDNKMEINRLSQVLKDDDRQNKAIHKEVQALIQKNDPRAHTNDNDYVFLSFVTHYLPVGLVGLLVAIIFMASMGSMASALNSLASTTIIDFYKRFRGREKHEKKDLVASRWATIGWGLFSVLVALFATNMGNLIEVVNIMGSLFYGTILGIFLVAFYFKNVGGTAVFYAALGAEILVCLAFYFVPIGFLWLNLIGCFLVVAFSVLVQSSLPGKKPVG